MVPGIKLEDKPCITKSKKKIVIDEGKNTELKFFPDKNEYEIPTILNESTCTRSTSVFFDVDFSRKIYSKNFCQRLFLEINKLNDSKEDKILPAIKEIESIINKISSELYKLKLCIRTPEYELKIAQFYINKEIREFSFDVGSLVGYNKEQVIFGKKGVALQFNIITDRLYGIIWVLENLNLPSLTQESLETKLNAAQDKIRVKNSLLSIL